MVPGISSRIQGQRGRQGHHVNCWKREGQREDGTAWGEGPSGEAQWGALDTEGMAAAEEEEAMRVEEEEKGVAEAEDLYTECEAAGEQTRD